MDGDNRAAQAHIDSLPEPRRSQMQHLHDVITGCDPGRGRHDVRLQRAADWLRHVRLLEQQGRPHRPLVLVGLANRKSYISLYSMGQRDGSYLVEAVKDAFPGARPAGAA